MVERMRFDTVPKQKKRWSTPPTKKGISAEASVPRSLASSWFTNPDGSPVDWRDENQVRAKVVAQWNENWNQPSDFIGSRVLTWIHELEQMCASAMQGCVEDGPDYDLAANILLGLVKLSSVSRQRRDLTAQIAMSRGPDLSQLSESELRAIELCAAAQLNELALRIGRLAHLT
jgi:hypothetical protein